MNIKTPNLIPMNSHVFSKNYFVYAVFLSVLVFNACTIKLIPAHDTKIAEQIEATAKAVDKFYFSMLETTTPDNGGRAYNKFVIDYVNIETELNSLLVKNKVRPLNENSTRICEITLELWAKYKEEHKKDNTLNNGIIRLNQKTFSDLFYAMQVAEEGKKVKGNPPQ